MTDPNATTSVSLLDRLRLQAAPTDWQRLLDLYDPLIRGWLRCHDLQTSDADDLVQEIMSVVVREMPNFQHDLRAGAFRSWLRTITVHCLRRFWRARQYGPHAVGGSGWEQHLVELEDPTSTLSRLWDQEHDRQVMRRLLERMEPDFRPATWRAFRRLVLEGVPAAAVAAELGLTVNAVLIAKSRVLQRFRQEARGLLEE